MNHGATDMRLLRRLRSKTMEEILALQGELESAPENRTPPGSFYLYTKPTLAKLDACSRAIAEKLIEAKNSQPPGGAACRAALPADRERAGADARSAPGGAAMGGEP